jgi:hypothetical protein
VRAAQAPIRAAIAGLWLALPLLCAACAATPTKTPIGMSDAAPEPTATAQPEPPHVAWPDFAAARAWPEAAPAFVAMNHHRDGSMLHVRVEPTSFEAYRQLAVDSPMPDGARVVAWHETPRGDLLGGYLLTKHGEAWSGDEIDAKGGLLVADHAPCIRCHDMAPTDHLFGPRAAAPATHVTGESIDPQRR